MKNILNEMENTLQGINSGVDEAKDQIRDLEDKEAETPHQNAKEKELKKNKDSIRSLQDNFQHTMNHGGARGEEREQEIENLFEKIMTENLSNLVKEVDI